MATKRRPTADMGQKQTATAVRGPASYFPSIERTYGRSIADWKAIIRPHPRLKHMELVNLLKSEHAMGHGHANALASHTRRGTPRAEPCCCRGGFLGRRSGCAIDAGGGESRTVTPFVGWSARSSARETIMHFCADCGQVLDVLSGRVDPCSSCGSTNVSVIAPAETATATVAVAPPGIQSLMNWSLVWLRVARERVAAAHAARKLFRSNPSGALSAEFHAGLIAIAAAAFAVEAEQLRVLGSKPKPVSPPPTRPWIGNAGDWLGQVLIEKGSIDVATAEGLGRLFDLRNSSVHPVATNELLVPHPVGTKTSPELVTYNADVAQELVNVADAVVAAISA